MTDELDRDAVLERLHDLLATETRPAAIRELDSLIREFESGRFDVRTV